MKSVDRLLKIASEFEKKMLLKKLGQDVVSPGKSGGSEPLDSTIVTLITRPIYNELTANDNQVLADILNNAVDKAWNAGKNPKTGFTGIGEGTKLVAKKGASGWQIDPLKSGVDYKVWLKDENGDDLTAISGLDVAFKKYLQGLYSKAFPAIKSKLDKMETSSTDIQHQGNMSSKFVEI